LKRVFIHLSTAACNYKGSIELGDDIVVKNNTEFIDLGKTIGNNTCLERVAFCRCNRRVPGDDTTRKFIEGFKCSASVKEIIFVPFSFSHGLGYELMNFYQDSNDRLEHIFIESCPMSYRGFVTLFNTLKACRNLRIIRIGNCYTDGHPYINDGCIGDIVRAIKSNYNLKALRLRGNNIGIKGCTKIANLLSDPQSNLIEVDLVRNNINDECVKILANALMNNKKLIVLCLDRNTNITRSGFDIFENLLCNTSSINATYLSNHTLLAVESEGQRVQMKTKIRKLMENNRNKDKNKVAMFKILKFHNHLSMVPFYEWDLKVLPIAIKWFDTAFTHFQTHNDQKVIGMKKLSAIYEFARMLPTYFVPTPLIQARSNKRKHSMMTRSRRGNGV